MSSYQELYRRAKKQLMEAGCESPAFDALQLARHVFGLDRTAFIREGRSPAPNLLAACFEQLVQRRADGYPLQYLLGKWEFMGLPFFVGEGVLIPRSDTEVLCEEVIRYLKTRERPRVLELCAGSGAVAVAVAHYCPGASVTAVEKSPQALTYCKKNAMLNGVSVNIRQDDVLLPPAGYDRYDALVANPPYIRTEEMAALPTEVCHEPEMALCGGEDGLVFYRAILLHWLPLLEKDGLLAVEIGEEQGGDVRRLFEAYGLQQIAVKQDLAGRDRVVSGIRRR